MNKSLIWLGLGLLLTAQRFPSSGQQLKLSRADTALVRTLSLLGPAEQQAWAQLQEQDIPLVLRPHRQLDTDTFWTPLSQTAQQLLLLYHRPLQSDTRLLQNYQRRVIENIWGVRYLVSDPDTLGEIVARAPEAYVPLFSKEGLAACEKRFYLPRFYFRQRIVAVSSGSQFLSYLAEPGRFQPFQQVAIENPRHRPQVTSGQIEAKIDVLSESAQELKLLVTSSAPGYLILADHADPRWQITRNGQAATWEVANGYQQALWLEAGQHHIRRWYQP
ncbi:MAG: hypothetical protein ACO1RX_17205 [Candidatus Sericytochromatia bacterium]